MGLRAYFDNELSSLYRSRQYEHANHFVRYGKNCYSQSDEDGLTLEIIKRIGISNGVFAEFGVGDGKENNTLILLGLNWRGFWCGGENLAFNIPNNSRLLYYKKWINKENISQTDFLNYFSKIDDFDVFSCIKIWTESHDKIIAKLSSMLINRNLLKVKISSKKFTLEEVEKHKDIHQKSLGFNNNEMNYFVFQKEMENNAYDPVKDEIKILLNDGKLTDIAQASDNFNISALSKPVKKFYLFAPSF